VGRFIPNRAAAAADFEKTGLKSSIGVDDLADHSQNSKSGTRLVPQVGEIAAKPIDVWAR
jgi:hypothetical protein